MTDTTHSIESITESFDTLLKNIDSIISKHNKNTARTKLGQYKKKLANIKSLGSIEKTKLLKIIIQYNALNELFQPN